MWIYSWARIVNMKMSLLTIKYDKTMDFGKKRLGNWVVTKYEKVVIPNIETGEDEEVMRFEACGGVPHIRIAPVSGEFLWEYSSFDPKFAAIDLAMSNEAESEALAECFAIDNQTLHSETGIFHLIYKLSMVLFYHVAMQRNLKGDENIVDAIIESFERVKREVDNLYGGAIDPTEVTEKDEESLREMRVQDELNEELKKEHDVQNEV
jgi:hypothetical protein